jgi:SAM-dependent methyltransferase
VNHSPETIRKRIKEVPAWWHNIDIGGVRTPGITPMASQNWIESAIDEDLTGKEVLDIGCWDGHYSFLAEARGAKRVVALDPGQGPCKPQGFLTAHELLGSKVDLRSLDVYQLGQVEGQFDYIFFFGVYYHLQDPMLALHLIFNKLKPGGVLLMEGLVRSGKKPYLYAYRPGIDLHPGDYCAATVPWLLLSCQSVGFSPAQFLSRYKGDNLLERPIRSVAWHLGLHAGKLKKAHRALIKAVKPVTPVHDTTNSETRDVYLARYVSHLAGNS